MFEIIGKRNSAIVFAEKTDKETKTQIASLLREEAFADSKIRIMPDTHTGKYTVVGTTMTLNGRIMPSLLGVDIGCGVEVVFLEEKEIDLPKFDKTVHELIPCGAKIHHEPVVDSFDFSKLNCLSAVNQSRAMRSLGTLGGGNHFIELDKAENGDLILLIHCGSRQAGSDVALYYQDLAYREACKKERKLSRNIHYQAVNEEEYYCKAIRREVKAKLPTTKQNAVLKGERFFQYINDVAIMQQYADLNRRTIAERICAAMQLHVKDRFSCVHNYVDKDSMILRKGAISARQNERVVIPLNMRDGSIIGVGLGNPEWNFSAPHGAGRACSRTEAKFTYTVEEYQQAMAGVYTTTATIGSLDECPMAYKPSDKIVDAVKDTVEIKQIIHPIYNFKAC